MLTRAQAWAWYFDRSPTIAASWGHQNGRWPMHLGDSPEGPMLDRQEVQCDDPACWCHLETAEGGDEDAR